MSCDFPAPVRWDKDADPHPWLIPVYEGIARVVWGSQQLLVALRAYCQAAGGCL
jgi:hypothetical protein